MFFPDPVRGLMEFRRVLRPGGRMAVSVNTVVERSYNHQINGMIARHVPGLAESVARTFALAEASKLRSLFDAAGFADFATDTVRHAFVLPSFDAYYGPFERGGCSTGQALVGLSEDIRRAVREEARRDLGDTGGPVKPEAEYRIAVESAKEREADCLTQPGEAGSGAKPEAAEFEKSASAQRREQYHSDRPTPSVR
jgi:hypothetical protein